MVRLKSPFPESFFDEEVRCGFTVTRKRKALWAVQMDMLLELDRVCTKHGIRYFADSGTLIGAIRHGGYIPWDDDIDIVMFREDYDKLCRVAADEFQPPLFFQNTYTDKEYIRGHAQLRNSATTGCILADLKKDFNRGVFVDIFPLDNIPDGKIAYWFYIRRIRLLWKLIWRGMNYDTQKPETVKGRIAGKCMQLLFRHVDYRKVFRHYENVCAGYNRRNTKRCSYVAYKRGSERHNWERRWFESSRRVPFEGISIMIPEGYDPRLRKEYGDYMEIRQVPASHGDTIIDLDTPYNEFLSRYRGMDLSEIQKENVFL